MFSLCVPSSGDEILFLDPPVGLFEQVLSPGGGLLNSPPPGERIPDKLADDVFFALQQIFTAPGPIRSMTDLLVRAFPQNLVLIEVTY